MSTSKHIDQICIAVLCLTLVLTILFMCGGAWGLSSLAKSMKYESTLFDASYVHKIDIVMDDWVDFIQTCENEEYASCTVVIDGEQHKNTAIRAKGNTSLSNVRSLGSERYSFKLEFDHYESGKSCDGLDKLCLNNLIQDNTMMKDFLVYQMMADFGADSPLSSFAYVSVNGEDWGLYLAVEGIEDSFLARNYGADAGELYKPDSMSFGGGRGNGKDFKMDEFDPAASGEASVTADAAEPGMDSLPQMPAGEAPQGGFQQMPAGEAPQGGMPQMPAGDDRQNETPKKEDGMGSDDVKLKYIDDDPASYPNIFDNAKTDISSADEKRLIAALKNLSAYTAPDETLDTEEVLRYFVVHNFVSNGDSYTGNMIHNYYLHEKDGKLGMIPWDYNLAFGTFQGGSASDAVNASIDSPVSGGSVDDRPMVGWIFSDGAYTAEYHELFSAFIREWSESGKLTRMIDDTAAMLYPYVEKDPTKFCTVEEFKKATAALSQFVVLRAEAVSRQLEGNDQPVDTGDLDLSDMGTMNNGFEGGGTQSPASPALPAGSEVIGENENADALPAMPDDGKKGEPGENRPEGNMDSDPRGDPAPGDSDVAKWGLVGLSGVTLVIGILIASKKKSSHSSN